MSSLNVQISKRKKGRYVTIVETFVDPITHKKSSRSIKTIGFIDDKLAEDPHYLDKIYQERDKLRKNLSEVADLRAEKKKRIYPSMNSPEGKDIYRAAPRLIYGDASIRAVWEELELDKWFKKTRFNTSLTYDLDLAVFYMIVCQVISSRSRLPMKERASLFFFDYMGNLEESNLFNALAQIAKRKDTIIQYLSEQINKLLLKQDDGQSRKSCNDQSIKLDRCLFETNQKLIGFDGFRTFCQELSDEQILANLPELLALEEKFRVTKAFREAGTAYIRKEKLLRGLFLICLMAVVMERIMHRRAWEKGLNFTFDYLQTLLTSLTLSPIYNSRNKEQLFLKTGLTSEKVATGKDLTADADKFMEVLGLEKLRTLETLPDIRTRLKIHLPLTRDLS